MCRSKSIQLTNIILITFVVKKHHTTKDYSRMHVFFYTFVGDEDRTTKEYHVNVIYIFLGKNMMQLRIGILMSFTLSSVRNTIQLRKVIKLCMLFTLWSARMKM